jgi:hypothetical protein
MDFLMDLDGRGRPAFSATVIRRAAGASTYRAAVGWSGGCALKRGPEAAGQHAFVLLQGRNERIELICGFSEGAMGGEGEECELVHARVPCRRISRFKS